MKIIGLLTKVDRNEKGYVKVEIEGLRMDAGKLDEQRFERWRSLLDTEVVAVVNVQWSRRENGKAWASRRIVGLYPANGRS